MMGTRFGWLMKIDDSATNAAMKLPLWPALIAMTGLQALVALALFAPGVLAPRLGLTVGDVGLFTTVVFAVGMATSLQGGRLTRSWGPCRVAACCAAAVASGMALATRDGAFWLIAAAICVGMAFGPETPASSTLLSRLATPKQRPLIFSIRQTGNQIGGILASLALPLIAVTAPTAGYGWIAVAAIVATLAFLALSTRYDAPQAAENAAINMSAAAAIVWSSRPLRSLAILSMPYSAMQLGINAFLVTFGVTVLHLGHVAAGTLLAIAQSGGLIGRLSWGFVASQWVPAPKLLIGLGVGMSATAIGLASTGAALPFAGQAILAFLLGLTASGWNGVFLAEVARLAPAESVAEITGAVLTASYAGLLLAPLLITIVATAGTLAASYVVLALCTLAASLQLLWTPHHDRA